MRTRSSALERSEDNTFARIPDHLTYVLAEFHIKEENGQVVAVEYDFSHNGDSDNDKKFSCPRQTISIENFLKYQQTEITWDEFVTVLKAFILGDKCQLNEINNAFKTMSKNGSTIDMAKVAKFLNIVAREFSQTATGVTDADVEKFILQGDANGDGNIDRPEFIQMFASRIGYLFVSSIHSN
ncbi:unnamed protein product [Didymodactylos carnosus]|uniref:EF-hand domain-containing protein n=1 Tax=Didymodactylos carnosus TaxID=1234261 RepID=A0A814WYP0_9BILA|nr:unnamed protein product [Didymodactylos carnosus]CAF3972973.1 unnamed protein product [Didymodactylos carnosus]